ncbi:Metallophos domain-containing protein [Planctomycetales bacterium 10988]|nr:Metallophos domain-containing protein [Planctomycetales bacterium 10988]
MAVDSPTAEHVIRAAEDASKINRELSFRHGNVVYLDTSLADEVMITADLHGHQDNFTRIMQIADLENHPRRHLILQEVCHGGPTYHDSAACKSHLMLAEVIQLKLQYPERVHFILSNHELSEMTGFQIRKDGRMINLTFQLGLRLEYEERWDDVHEALKGFIGSCPLGVLLPDNTFICHSVPESVDSQGFDVGVLDREWTEEDLNNGGDVFRLVWGRDYRPANAETFAKLLGTHLLINGHTPCEQGFQVPNDWQVILDCCSRPASYVLLPLNTSHNQQALIQRIQML